MKARVLILLCGLVGLLVSGAIPVWAQEHMNGMVVWPDSSVEREHEIGLRAHTNHLILLHPQLGGGAPAGMTPDQIRAVYGLLPYTLGQIQGAQTIVIVDAYDYPDALADFNAFSSLPSSPTHGFGLPTETSNDINSPNNKVLQVVYANGSKPAYNSGWSQEEALDIEWAHALAPTAKIVLVEAASNSLSDLLTAVDVASAITGAQEVSMSWGSSEFSSETAYDRRFTAQNVVYFAASGDSGGKVIWPSASPNVVSAGGTTLKVDSSGNVSETGWSGSGGGNSRFEPRPLYQNGIQNIVGTKRGTPDLSFDADPYTGVSVYWQGGWYVFGGTSVSTPALAAIVNLAASKNGLAANTADELWRVYSNSTYSSPTPNSGNDFRDIISGSAARFRCKSGWDFVTGIGSNWGLVGK